MRRPRDVERAVGARRDVRDRLKVAARRDVFDAVDNRGLSEPRGHSRGTGGPVDLLVLPRDASIKEYAPLLLGSRGKPEALERNPEQDDVAGRRPLRVRMPHRVPREIPALPFGVRAVGLHAVCVHLESVRMLQIAERIDVDGHGVFIVRKRVARHHVRADAAGVGVEALKRDVEELRVVADVHDRTLRDRLAVVRKTLEESLDASHPEWSIQTLHRLEIGPVRRSADARDRDVRRLDRLCAAMRSRADETGGHHTPGDRSIE